jgi:Rrf2 family iron-sulfur cluster assembly transcriptional regulator
MRGKTASDWIAMRLSTKGRYAVMAMVDLARRENDAARGVALADIAARQEISLSYLEQLFARLRRRGLVRSARGPGGGYRLVRPAEATTIAEIVHAVDEPLRATRCQPGRGCMIKGERCLTHDLWADLGDRIEDYLASVTLADVIGGRLRRAA